MNNINKERFILLDLLRFILAAIVVLYHYFYLSSIYGLVPVLNSSFKYLYICGYLGVHIFFIVSGFVILHTAQNRSWVEFIKARIGRLLPGFMIVSTIGFLFCLLIPNVPHTNNIYLKDFFFNFFGISIFPKMNQFFNVVFIDDSMWSLRYEAGFYIVISAILFFNKIKYINIFAYIWIILSILRNEFSVPLLSRIPTNLISADYSFFFCLGIFIYIIYHNKEKIQNKTFEKLNYLFLFISFIFSVKFVYTQMENFNSLIFKEVSPTFAVLYFLIIFVLFLISVFPGFLNKNNCIKNILENKSFVNSVSVLGGSSFILYLIHQSVGHRIMYFLGNWTHFQTFSLFILITLFSIFLHVNFEKYLAKKIKNILNKI